jgi:hypothetical protein
LTKGTFTDYNEFIQALISMFDENTKKTLDETECMMVIERKKGI